MLFGTVRDMQKGGTIVDEIKGKPKGGRMTLIHMELDSLASIKEGVKHFLTQSKTLNVLICT